VSRLRLTANSKWTPRLAALLTGLVGIVNIASALTPDIHWRGHLLLQFEALQTLRVFHALALPVGAALLMIAPYLWRRRIRALKLAIALLVLLGLINLLKGLDFEVTLFGWAIAAWMWAGRDAFTVIQEPVTLRSAVWRVPAIGAFGLALCLIADAVSQSHFKVSNLLGEQSALLRFHKGPQGFEHHAARLFGHTVQLAWVPLATHLVEIGTLLAIAYVIFRPLAAPRTPPTDTARRLAEELVRAYGRDTLSFFKLRPDKLYFFSEDRTAFVGYRVEAGVLLLSGDPVGEPEQYPGLLLQLRAFARARGLKLGAVGVSAATLPIYDGLGLRTMYLGDEAVLELDSFSLEGRAIRKVRQSVSRLTKAGFSSELQTLDTLDDETLRQVERVLELGRLGAPERGFSMAMDSIRGACEQDTLFVLARDPEGTVRGVLHFVPCYGRPAVSLSFMRRDPSTPNGLTEFLVTEAVVHLRSRGIDELSLNFATAARYMHSPENPLERLVGWGAIKFDRWFQVESLYRFNAKFFPRWEPRYLVFEGALGLPRTSLAAMWVEGQLPKPSRPRLAARRSAPASVASPS
jgi:lysyl-tRNA synthetase, class II